MGTVAPRPRANVYVDGFNLYHGCFDDLGGRADWRQYRWLDLRKFCTAFLPDYEIGQIRYFTALVNPTPDNPGCRNRQLAYIRALKTASNLSVHEGRFATNVKTRVKADPLAARPTPIYPLEKLSVIEDEEKGSDVNLASYLLLDAFKQDYEIAVVISNDSDLAEPIRLVRSELGRKVLVVNPRKKVAADLQGIADSYKSIRVWALRDSQFPQKLTDNIGTISRPVEWDPPTCPQSRP